MSIIAILEVAIGMIFAWLVLSLAGMYIQELIVSALGWRASMLENFIGNMLTDPSLARQFYDHPLIKALHNGENGKNRPAYIPSAQFSMALFDIIRNAPKEAALIQETLYSLQDDIARLNGNKQAQAQATLNLAIALTRKAVASEGGPEVTSGLLDDVKKLLRRLSSDVPALQPKIESRFLTFGVQKKQVDAILASIQASNGGAVSDSALVQFRTGLAVMSVTHPDVKQAIEALISEIEELSQQAESTLQMMRSNIEDWFNSSMDRLSGWYKRRAQILAFIIGMTIAVLVNVDSMQLATQLWRDPSVRQALAAQADAFANQNPNGVPNPDAGQLLALNMQINQLNIPVGWIGTGLQADSSGGVPLGDGSQKLCTFFPDSSVDLFGVHIGNKCYPIINTPTFTDPTGWLMKLIGLLLTGLAAAQGAPFWFDILKNLVNVRSTGAAPAK